MHAVNVRSESTVGAGQSRWNAFAALALLLALSCWGPTVDAAYDPTVEAVQQALTERGFEPGEIDGVMGSRTRNALTEFQRSAGLSPTGEIDAATRVALGLDPPAPGPAPSPAASSPSTATTTPADTAESGTAPEAGLSGTETPQVAPETEPARTKSQRPAPATKSLLRFSTLGWHPPQTGAGSLERFIAIGAPRNFRRGSDALFVPKADLVFVLRTGERIPGFDCDPGAGRLEIEFVFGPDGPVIFTPAAGGEVCQMGIGIAIEVGRTLAMQPIDWNDVRYPQGIVRVTGKGLQYID